MKVHQLRDWLDNLASDMDNAVVVLALDAEGNDFSPLAEPKPGIYKESSTWGGEFIDGEDQAAHMKPLNAICLWPVN